MEFQKYSGQTEAFLDGNVAKFLRIRWPTQMSLPPLEREGGVVARWTIPLLVAHRGPRFERTRQDAGNLVSMNLGNQMIIQLSLRATRIIANLASKSALSKIYILISFGVRGRDTGTFVSNVFGLLGLLSLLGQLINLIWIPTDRIALDGFVDCKVRA